MASEKKSSRRLAGEKYDLELCTKACAAFRNLLHAHGEGGPEALTAMRIVDALARKFAVSGSLSPASVAFVRRAGRVLGGADLPDAERYALAVEIIVRHAVMYQESESEERRSHVVSWCIGELYGRADHAFLALHDDDDRVAGLLARYAPTKKPGKLTAPSVLANLLAPFGALGLPRAKTPELIEARRRAIAREMGKVTG